MHGNGQAIQREQPGEEAAPFPPAADVIVQGRQNEKVRGEGGVAKGALHQNRAEHKRHRTPKHQRELLYKQPQQQGGKPALQRIAEEGEQPEILEGAGQKRRQQAEQRGEQGDGIGKGNA